MRKLWDKRFLVLELSQSSALVPGHGEVDLLVFIIPVKLDADVMVTSPIHAQRIVRFESGF
jgi:hypothetical protein